MLASLAGVLFDGFAYGMLLFLLSVGLSVTLGMMNFVNLAHCSFAMIGGYVAVTLVNSFGWPFLASLPIAFLAAALVSIVLERALYRRLYRATDLDQCLFTIGIVFISVAVAAYFYGTLQQPISTPPYLRGSVQFMGMSFGAYRLFLIVTALAIAALLVYSLEYTRFGAQVRAAVDNQRMARGLGIDVDRAFAVTFALGGGLAGGLSHLPGDGRHPDVAPGGPVWKALADTSKRRSAGGGSRPSSGCARCCPSSPRRRICSWRARSPSPRCSRCRST